MTDEQCPRPLDLPLDEIELPPGFHRPDPYKPIDLERSRRRVPPEATVKGMFFTSLEEEVRSRGFDLASRRLPPFLDYPMTELLDLYEEAARVSHAGLPTYEAMRRLARPAFRVFSDSLVGRTVFGVIGRDVQRVLGLAARAWPHAANVGKLEVERIDEQTALVRASEFYLTEPVAVGIAEGVLLADGRRGLVAARMSSPIDGEFWIRWA